MSGGYSAYVQFAGGNEGGKIEIDYIYIEVQRTTYYIYIVNGISIVMVTI